MDGAFTNTSNNGGGNGGNQSGDYYIISYNRANDGWPTHNYFEAYNGHIPFVAPGTEVNYKSNNPNRQFWLYKDTDFNYNIENYECKGNNNNNNWSGNTVKVSSMTKKSYNDLPQEVKNWLTGKGISSSNIKQIYYHDW